MRLRNLGAGLAAVAVMATAHAAAPAKLDQWGLTAEEWLLLDGTNFRSQIDVNERRAEIQRKAAAGEVDAMTIAAGALADTVWGPPDYALALRYATRAAEAGSPRAMGTLAALLAQGVGAPPDPQRAYYWFSRAADAGVAVAMMQKGQALLKGTGVAADPVAAVALFRRAADLGLPAGAYSLAMAYATGTVVAKDTKAALDLMRKAAEGGLPEGMAWYGSWLDDPNMVAAPDEASAAHWLGRAAEKGNVDAAYLYGERLYFGSGTAKNAVAAADWYGRAAEAGHSRARFRLASMLSRPESGIAQDPARAMTLYKQVVQDASAPAAFVQHAWFNMGALAHQRRDYPLARAMFVEADKRGDPDAKAEVAALDAWLAEQQRVQERREAAARQAQQEAEKQAAARAAADKSAALALARADAAQAAGGPSTDDVLIAHARSAARYVGGHTTSRPGEVAIDSIFGGIQHYERRYVSNLRCARISAATYRCDYDFQKEVVGADDSFLGKLIEMGGRMAGSSSDHRQYVFAKTSSGGWTSNGLDQTNIEFAQASAQAAAQRPASSSPPCEIRGGMAPVMRGGMIGGVTWDSTIRRPC